MARDPRRDRAVRAIATVHARDRKPGLFEAPTEALRIIACWCLINLIAAILCLMLIQKAFAHDPMHSELNGWFLGRHNWNDLMYCDGNAAIVFGDCRWRTNKSCHEVLFEDTWRNFSNRDLTRAQDNTTGSALLWVWGGHFRCINPGTRH